MQQLYEFFEHTNTFFNFYKHFISCKTRHIFDIRTREITYLSKQCRLLNVYLFPIFHTIPIDKSF